LSRFDFTLKHILGTKIENVDKLSRRPDWKVEVENKKIAREKDEEAVRVVEEMKKAGVEVLRGDE